MAFSGTYRGTRFRSLLELSAIRSLEAEGLVLGSTMLYEHTRIPYGKGRKREYIVDLTIPGRRELVEVKPTSRVNAPRNRNKRIHAEAWCLHRGWTYRFITDSELRSRGLLLTLVEAASIPEVGLDGRALRRLRRRPKRTRRKASR